MLPTEQVVYRRRYLRREGCAQLHNRFKGTYPKLVSNNIVIEYLYKFITSKESLSYTFQPLSVKSEF